ncbi:MAG: twin-arginine translocation signal domain-containing protein [Steroidobacteraceae bacterium]
MSGSGVSRRDFLQIVGLGGATIALSGCGNTSIESGAELVESYSSRMSSRKISWCPASASTTHRRVRNALRPAESWGG